MINVLIIGLGRIGAGNIGLAGDMLLSHLAAVRATPGFVISGLVDSDPAARAAVLAGYPDIEANKLFGDLGDVPMQTGEVIVLCTPASVRSAVIKQTLKRRPHLVVVEKPLAISINEARQIVLDAKRAQTMIRVNFHRRFDPRHRHWRAMAPAKPQAIVMRYSKGMMNYASHMIDLLLDWYGPIEAVQTFALPDSRATDPSPSFCCHMRAGFDAVAIGIDRLTYDQFEIDILGVGECLKIAAGGADIRRYAPVVGLHYKGYSHLAEVERDRDIGPVGGFAEFYAAIAAHLRDDAPLPGCDGHSALTGMAVLEAVRRSFAAGGVAVAPEPTLLRDQLVIHAEARTKND